MYEMMYIPNVRKIVNKSIHVINNLSANTKVVSEKTADPLTGLYQSMFFK